MNRSFYRNRYFELEKELKEISKEYRFRLFKSDIDELNVRQDLFYSDYLKRLSEIKNEIDICKANTKTRCADNIVFTENGKILLLRRRSMDESFPNHWTLPGGHVGDNEDCATAAMRELEEEAGIRVDKVTKVGEYDDDKCHIEYFESSVLEDTQLILSDDETEDYKWLTINEIKDDSIKMPFNMKENLMKIVNPFEYPIKKIIKAYQDGIISGEVLREALIKAKKDYGVGKKQEQVVVHDKKTGQTFMRKQTVGHKEDDKKDENKKSEKEPEQDLNEVAKNTGESKLQDAIKHHSDPKVRQAAHDELKRREQEEHPENEKEKPEKEQKKDEVKEDKKDEMFSDLTGKFIKPNEVETGKPFKMTFSHNTDKSPVKFRAMGQDIEPHGKYMLNVDGKTQTPGWEIGEIEFKNPLVVDFISTAADGWKGELVKKFGKKGKKLSEELIKRGYDAIITKDDRYNELGEIVSLKDFDPNYTDKRKMVKSEEFEKSEKLTGGEADNLSLQDIAKKHKVELSQIKKELKQGIEVEMEHTDDPKEALEIAMDHLSENYSYYSELSKMEAKIKE